MTAIRRGKVTTPHRATDTILLTRSTGEPIRIPIERILSFDEFAMSNSLGKIVIVNYDLSSTAVRESFDAIEQEINGKAVPQ